MAGKKDYAVAIVVTGLTSNQATGIVAETMKTKSKIAPDSKNLATYGLHELHEITNFIYDRTLLGKEHHSVELFGINFSGSVYPEETSINYGVVDLII